VPAILFPFFSFTVTAISFVFFDQKTKMLPKTMLKTMFSTGPFSSFGWCQYMKPTPFYSPDPCLLTFHLISQVPAFLFPIFPFTVTAIPFVYSPRTFFR
jgi:hypothetical protein